MCQMERTFEKLTEYIEDDDKVVTIASFANDAKLSLEEAKEAIRKYVEINKGSGKIHATYVLNGVQKNGKSVTVSIVKDHELEEKRKLYEDGATETVFSIQKASKIDYNFVALADPFGGQIVEGPIEGSIVSENCKKRALKKKKIPVDGPITFVPKKEPETKPKASGIGSMFNKVAQSKAEEPKPKQEKPISKKNGGISNFFSKTNKNEGVVKQEDKVEVIKSDNEKPEEVEMKIVQTGQKIIKNEDKIAKLETKKKPSSKRKAKTEAEDGKNGKRRKRIMVMEEPDSDDIFESEKEEDVIEKSYEEPEKTENRPPPPKNKIRKAVDRTYEDEEGFIVTKTEYVYETASEDEPVEEKPKSKPIEKKNSSNSESEPVKGKKGAKKPTNQPTLMSFFTKK